MTLPLTPYHLLPLVRKNVKMFSCAWMVKIDVAFTVDCTFWIDHRVEKLRKFGKLYTAIGL